MFDALLEEIPLISSLEEFVETLKEAAADNNGEGAGGVYAHLPRDVYKEILDYIQGRET
jgi:hypothetical protein